MRRVGWSHLLEGVKAGKTCATTVGGGVFGHDKEVNGFDCDCGMTPEEFLTKLGS